MQKEDSPLHQNAGTYGVLNIDEIKKPIAQFCCTFRDEHLEPN
jgi:hypothetical protein